MTQSTLFQPNRRASAPAGIVLLSARELDKMRQVGQLAAELLDYLAALVQPGVSTQLLNDAAARWTQDRGAVSAPLGYTQPGQPPFPGSICTSVNEVVCHGIPSTRQVLQSGDLINIDVTPKLAGYHGDTSRTFVVGTAAPEASRLVEVTHQALMLGIAAVRPGARVGDIGAAIQTYAEAQGFSVVRELVGHGVGRQFHGEPQIPHYGQPGTGPKLRPGMVFTIEPMLNEGGPEIEVLRDRWTIVTRDRKRSAQFEHTVAVTTTGVEILTQRAA